MADAPTRGGVTGTPVTMWQSPYNVTVSYGSPNAGIIRNTGADWFSPLNPISPIAPPEVAGRQWDFTAGYNLYTTPRINEPIGFATLRALADPSLGGFDLLRTVIETRKDQVAKLKWSIRTRDEEATTGSTPNVDPRAKAAEKFFHKPDGINSWDVWVRMLLEDLFVIDAPTIYVHRTNGGDILALNVIDGATIKPVIDDWGRRPMPYVDANTGEFVTPVAYQQVLHGFPAVDYTVEDIVYRPRNVRVNKAFGCGPVEQILTTISIALRRQLFLLDYYQEGSIPDAMCGVPETWTTDQIRSYQTYWDSYFEGNLGKRRRMKFVPGGTAKNYVATKEPELKNEFDEWLIKIICFAFSISPQPFIKQMNRSSAQTQKNMSQQEGLEPIKLWLKTLVDEILAQEFGADDLEFAWLEGEDVDPAVQATILSTLVSKGIIRPNEARMKLGMDPDENPAADKLMVLTATGYVLLEANTIEGQQTTVDAFGEAAGPAGAPPAPAAGGNAKKPAKQPSARGASKSPSKTKSAADRPEKLAGTRFHLENSEAGIVEKRWRPFVRRGLMKTESPIALSQYGSLYVMRPLLNGDDLIQWANANGFASTLAANDMHVTIAFSRAPVDWSAIYRENSTQLVAAGGVRTLQRFGDDAVVLGFSNDDLVRRHDEFGDAGASWDYDQYLPHVTISYQGADIDIEALEPYQGLLHFGPEEWSDLQEDWEDGFVEVATEELADA